MTTTGETVLVSKSLANILTFWRPGSADHSWADEYADLMGRPETQRIKKRVSSEGIAFADAHAPIMLGDDGRVWDGHHRICIALQYDLHYLACDVVNPDQPRVDQREDKQGVGVGVQGVDCLAQ